MSIHPIFSIWYSMTLSNKPGDAKKKDIDTRFSMLNPQSETGQTSSTVVGVVADQVDWKQGALKKLWYPPKLFRLKALQIFNMKTHGDARQQGCPIAVFLIVFEAQRTLHRQHHQTQTSKPSNHPTGS